MSSLKSGAVLLLLAVPFALYVAWQVRGVTRADVIAPDPPAEKGLPEKDTLAAARGKAERWKGDVGKAAGVTLQFGQFGADDRAADEDCNALARAAARRSAPLTNLRALLGESKAPQFVGDTKPVFEDFRAENAALAAAAAEVERWFDARLPVIDGQRAADQAHRAFEAALGKYAGSASPLKNRGRVIAWKVRARARLAEALADAARTPYDEAVRLPLPLPAGDPNVTTALAAMAELREQIRELDREAERANKDGLVLPAEAAEARRQAQKAADEWQARDGLLGLYADPTLLTDPAKAAGWLGAVRKVYGVTQSDSRRKEIRDKVQQFSAAFVPADVLLDDQVVLNKKVRPRKQVYVQYSANGRRNDEVLKATLDGLNEFNAAARYPAASTRVIYDGGEFDPALLGPTELSKAAQSFHAARTALTDRKGEPKWSAESIEELKKKCEPLGDAVNRLKIPGKPTGEPHVARIGDRLSSLAEGAAANPALFGK